MTPPVRTAIVYRRPAARRRGSLKSASARATSPARTPSVQLVGVRAGAMIGHPEFPHVGGGEDNSGDLQSSQG